MAEDPAESLFVKELMSMGFTQEASTAAVLATNNMGVEPALNHMLQGADDDDDEGDDGASGSGLVWGVAASQAVGPSQVVVGVPSGSQVVVQPDGEQAPATFMGVTGECKVVLVVADELQMSPGKLAAQCSHAAVGLYRAMSVSSTPWLDAWQEQGEKTVVLRGDTMDLLVALQAHAQELQLLTYMVEDAGRTEVASGSKTVLAIGGLSDIVDMVTGHLKTLR